LQGLALRVAILTRRPWAILFHPPNPTIALQSFTRDAPFSQVAMATEYFMVVPSLLVRSLKEQPGSVQTCAREGAPPIWKYDWSGVPPSASTRT